MSHGFKYVFARKLKLAMETGEFRLVSFESYENDFEVPGIEYVCEYRGRRFYFSESKSEVSCDVRRFIKVLSHPKDFSPSKPVIWPNRHGEEGLYLEVWPPGGQWYKFHTPMRTSQSDEFSEVAADAAQPLKIQSS